MNNKLEIYKKELQTAKHQLQELSATSPLTDKTPAGKTVALLKSARLKVKEFELRVKIEECKEDSDPEWRIKEFEEQLANVVAQVRAYNNDETPSKRYTN